MPSTADSTKTIPAEHALRMKHAHLVQKAGHALRAKRDVREARERETQALADIAEDIASVAPLFTDDQLRALQPILSGILDDRATVRAEGAV